MDDDKTVIQKRPGPHPTTVIPPVIVKYQSIDGSQQRKQFNRDFTIGRDLSCDIHIDDDTVSRRHAVVHYRDGEWWLDDAHSANGTYLNGRQVESSRLEGAPSVQLGASGPTLWIECSSQASPPSLAALTRKYFDAEAEDEAGEHTMMVRKAIQEVARKQSKPYKIFIGISAVVLMVFMGVLAYQSLRFDKVEKLAIDIFYNMKDLELQIAAIEDSILEAGDTRQLAAVSEMKSRLASMESQYETFAQQISGHAGGMREEDRLILRVARIFGECEIDVPPRFVSEVKEYINKWRSTNRFGNAIERARNNGLIPLITNALEQEGLPPQFFYLALQESNFDHSISGPETRFGIAKGMWQFIPDTAMRYGLKTGPLQNLRRFDPDDDRFDVELATFAAARYLRDIYTTEAQASGLLVMASYNWGENRVTRLIRKMPENPRERNFWSLLEQHNIPEETYDYVYYIFSAAVIGENPRLFGFDFDNPLGGRRS